MDIDQYAYCPCGSGKKFKWCCQNIYKDIERAYNQLQDGQQEVALRIINQVTQANPTNPEVWGQKAQVHLYLEQVEEAEDALNKAFEINPNYPFGLLMRARLRSDEGEFTGALILARKAAEAYHPEALDYLAQAYALIYQIEMRRNRPIAAHAALRILIRCQPSDPELRQAYEQNFGAGSHLPACARADYTFQQPAGDLGPERRRAWDEVLAQVASPRINSLAAAFEQLTTQDAQDAAAWYNLAVVQSWLGENRKALDAVDRYLPLEADETRAGGAAAMAAVLVCGLGLEEESDWKQYSAVFQLRDPQPLVNLLQEWHDSGRLLMQPTEEQKVLTGMVLEDVAPAIVTSETPVGRDRRLAGYLFLLTDQFLLRLWGPDEEAFNRLLEEIKTRTAQNLTEGPARVGPTTFGDVVAPALLFPSGAGLNQEQARQAILDNAGKYFEEGWIHRSLKFLAGNTPLDAAGHPVLRKKVVGAIQFLEDCARIGVLGEYDFGRLRHRLGLDGAAPAPTAAAPGESRPAGVDPSGMNTQELAGLAVEGLSDEQLEKAFQAARKLDADEVAAKFGSALTARPQAAGATADRYPLFAFLVQRSMGEGNTDAALDLVNEGQKQDCEHNEGRRRNDYELRRGEVHVKRREVDQALDVFTRLIERSPENLGYRGKAVEGMLSLRQPDRALKFAEEGLTEARRQHNRDSEQYLMELADAARRQTK